MIKLSQWLDPEPIEDVVHELADPKLSYEKDRDQVNRLVLNLVIKYLAEYLGARHDDEGNIRQAIRKALVRTEENVEGLILEIMGGMMAQLTGENIILPGAHNDDLFSVQCAADLRSTAAIVKEIIFNENFDIVSGCGFTSIDLGSGTGILSMASIVSGMRRRARNITTIALDLSKKAVAKSEAVMGAVIRRLRYEGDIELAVRDVDISREGLMRVFDDMPLSFWISETINEGTPAMEVGRHGIKITSKDRMHVGMHLLGMARQVDPYQIVLHNTLRDRSCFYDDVREGRTAMFPDAINDLFMPDGKKSTLLMRTGMIDEPVILPEIGGEFLNFEGLRMAKRWP